MPSSLAQRLSAVQPSATLAMAARASELRARGVTVFNFTVGEPDFEPPGHVSAAAKTAIDRGASKYTPVSGIQPLREAVAASVQRTRGVAVGPADVCISTGAKQALYNIAMSLFEPGDEVILPAPYWVSYPEQVLLAGATPIVVPSTVESGFSLPLAGIRAALSPRTKAIVLNSPNNPTGMLYRPEALLELFGLLRSHDCWVVSDEIYCTLAYDGRGIESAYALAGDMRERVILVDGVSKAYAMTGWRIGWAVAPQRIIQALDLVQGQSTSGATAAAQHAALAALTGPQENIASMRATFEARRNQMLQGLARLQGVTCIKPEGAFYVFPDCRALLGKSWKGHAIATDVDLAGFLLDEAHAVCVPGSAFGAPGFMRLSYATDEATIAAGTEAIRTAVAKLS